MTARKIALLAAAGLLAASRAGAGDDKGTASRGETRSSAVPNRDDPRAADEHVQSQQSRQDADRMRQQVEQESHPSAEKAPPVRQRADARDGQVASSPSATRPQGQTIDGKLTKVARDELTLETKDGHSQRFKVSGSTQVTVDGEQKSLGDLREGVQVRAAYDERGGDRTVTRIEASRGATGDSTR